MNIDKDTLWKVRQFHEGQIKAIDSVLMGLDKIVIPVEFMPQQAESPKSTAPTLKSEILDYLRDNPRSQNSDVVNHFKKSTRFAGKDEEFIRNSIAPTISRLITNGEAQRRHDNTLQIIE